MDNDWKFGPKEFNKLISSWLPEVFKVFFKIFIGFVLLSIAMFLVRVMLGLVVLRLLVH